MKKTSAIFAIVSTLAVSALAAGTKTTTTTGNGTVEGTKDPTQNPLTGKTLKKGTRRT